MVRAINCSGRNENRQTSSWTRKQEFQLAMYFGRFRGRLDSGRFVVIASVLGLKTCSGNVVDGIGSACARAALISRRSAHRIAHQSTVPKLFMIDKIFTSSAQISSSSSRKEFMVVYCVLCTLLTGLCLRQGMIRRRGVGDMMWGFVFDH